MQKLTIKEASEIGREYKDSIKEATFAGGMIGGAVGAKTGSAPTAATMALTGAATGAVIALMKGADKVEKETNKIRDKRNKCEKNCNK